MVSEPGVSLLMGNQLDEANRADKEDAGEKFGWAFWVTSVCSCSHAHSEDVFSGGEGAPEPFEKMLFTYHVAASLGEAGCTRLCLCRGVIW